MVQPLWQTVWQFLARLNTAVAGIAQWTGRWPANQGVMVRFPVRAHAWVAGQIPVEGVQEATTH